MICPNCKNNVPDGTKFCPNCGNNMSEGNQANTNQFQQSVNAENQQTNNGQNMNRQQMNYGQQMNNQQANYGQQMNNGQPQFNGNIQMPVKVPLGAKTWFVILMLIVFWPVGLYCMWKHKKFPMAVRIIVSVVAGIWFLSYVSAMFSDSSSSTYSTYTPSYDSSYDDSLNTPGDDNTADVPSTPSVPETSAPQETPSVPETSSVPETPSADETPSASSGESPYYVYSVLSSALEGGDLSFTISDKASVFLQGHPDLFPAASADACKNFVDTSIEYRHIQKSPSNYGDTLMSVTGNVIEIYETAPEQTGLSKPLTEMQVMDDSGNSYYVFYIGSIDVFEGDYVSVYGLPMGTSSATNISGGTTLFVVLAGSSVQVQTY